MKALVIGSTGLVGRHLVKKLLENGHTVIGTSRTTTQVLFASPLYTHVALDISNRENFSQLPTQLDWVFNTSGYVPKSRTSVKEAVSCMMINEIGVQNILEYMLAHGIKRLIHSSSVTVYGIPPKLYVYEDSPLIPVIAYGVSKLAAEAFCEMYKKMFGLEITMLRYSPIYGDGLTQQTAFTLFMEKALKNENITLFQQGKRGQDYVYVDDTVQANILAAEKKVLGVFNIASGKLTTMKELAQTIISVLGSQSKIRYDTSQKEEFSIGVDIKKALKELGYAPQYSLEEGLSAYCHPRNNEDHR